ncbi:hypothetical protein E2C01_070139 [Portunus trituberculatus]|uniref:Uncharacterized protein n=1 Tax=Portunus trituberculatus TaxID=210409 RepID=A0A5B7I0S7_PORTR|nr:hypothetical protein [Portunus trituberculatus]
MDDGKGIYGDLAPSAPHVVNIDVESGRVTVESPQDSDFLSSVHMQMLLPIVHLTLVVFYINIHICGVYSGNSRLTENTLSNLPKGYGVLQSA